MKRWIEWMMIGIAVVLLTGCRSENRRTWDNLVECRRNNDELSLRVNSLESEKVQLTEQLHTLSKLDAAARLETLDTLEKIRIGKRTGFYDKKGDGTNDTLVVYLEPKDTAQDTIKAIGKVTIELWNLNVAEDKAKLGEWTLEPNQLHNSWGGNIFASYYRIKLPLKNAPDKTKEYTLKITFTDYLTGKVLTDQKVLSVK